MVIGSWDDSSPSLRGPLFETGELLQIFLVYTEKHFRKLHNFLNLLKKTNRYQHNDSK